MKSEQIVSIYEKSIDLQFISEIINQEGTFLINSKDHYMSFFLAQYLAKAILCDKNCLNLKKPVNHVNFLIKINILTIIVLILKLKMKTVSILKNTQMMTSQ